MKRLLPLLLLALLLCPSHAWADTRTLSVAGGNWNTAATWVEVAVPTAASDIVMLGNGLSGPLTIDGTSGSPSLARSVDFTNYTGTLTQASSKELDVGDGSGGSFKLVGGMVYSPNTGSILKFLSTTTGNTITTAGKSLGPVTFNGSGGAWTLADAFTSSRDLTMTAGTVTANSTINVRSPIINGGTLNLGGTLTASSTFTVAGGSLLGAAYTITGVTACTLTSGTLTVAGLTSTSSCTVSGATVSVGASGLSVTSETVSSGSLTMTGPLTATTTSVTISGSGTLDATGQTVTAATSINKTSTGTFNAAVLSAGTTISLTGGTTSITGNISGTTLTMSGSTMRSITFGTGATITLSGTGAVLVLSANPTNLTLVPGTSKIKITDTSATAKTISGGGQTFYDMQVSGAASAGSVTISQSNTFHTFTADADANVKFANGTTQTMTTLAATGTSGHTISLTSDSVGLAATLSASSTSFSGDYLSLQDIAKSGAVAYYAGTHSTDNTGNTGWIFGAAPTSGQHFVAGM